jgi:hypothetical protein
MLICPICRAENEAGTLFCEHCKADLPAAAAPAEGSLPPTVVLEVGVPRTLTEDQSTRVVTVSAEVIRTARESVPAVTDPEQPFLAGPLPGSDAATTGLLPPDAEPKLVVLRGLRVSAEYRIYEGPNYIGRQDEKPVDIDLEEQEASDRVWASRQHAVVTLTNGLLTIEDLNSLNGTFVNRARVHPNQPRTLTEGDVIQIGTVQLKVTL